MSRWPLTNTTSTPRSSSGFWRAERATTKSLGILARRRTKLVLAVPPEVFSRPSWRCCEVWGSKLQQGNPMSNEALLLSAWALEAAGSLRSRAAIMIERRSRAPRR